MKKITNHNMTTWFNLRNNTEMFVNNTKFHFQSTLKDKKNSKKDTFNFNQKKLKPPTIRSQKQMKKNQKILKNKLKF